MGKKSEAVLMMNESEVKLWLTQIKVKETCIDFVIKNFYRTK